MYFVCEFGYLLVELEKWLLWNEVTLELDYWWISWPTTAYFGICHHWELQQPRNFHGRSEWLWTWYQIQKKCGKEWMPSKILVISQHAMQLWCWKSRQDQDALEQKAVAWPRKWITTRTEFYWECWLLVLQ